MDVNDGARAGKVPDRPSRWFGVTRLLFAVPLRPRLERELAGEAGGPAAQDAVAADGHSEHRREDET